MKAKVWLLVVGTADADDKFMTTRGRLLPSKISSPIRRARFGIQSEHFHLREKID